MEPWIQTYTRRKFYPLNPNIEDICLVDIAHALSNICRFSGHVKYFHSVAHHSVLVSEFCKSKENKLQALLHDGSEYVLGDIATPLKQSSAFAEYRKHEANLSKMIYRKFGLPEDEHPDVKMADRVALATEAASFLDPRDDWSFDWGSLNTNQQIISLTPKEAEKLFINKFHELYLEKFGEAYGGY